MKNRIFASMVFAASLLFASCTNTSAVINKKVAVTGVSLDANELYIIANDDDNTHQFTATVEPDNATNKKVTWSVSDSSVGTITNNGLFTALSEGETTVTVRTSDGGFTDTCLIHVEERVKTLDRIELSGNYQTSFWSTEVFNYTGLVVTAYYNFGPSENVTGFTVSQPDMTLYQQQTITVSYIYGGVEKTASYFVTVREDTPVGISLSGSAPTSFNVGEEFTAEGLTVTLAYTSGYSRPLSASEYTIDEVDMSTPGTKQVTVRYANDSSIIASYTIEVSLVRELVGISLSGSYPTTFEVGDEFSYEGLVVTADYVTETVTLDSDQYTVSEPNMNVAGEGVVVTVSYTDGDITVSETYTIDIVEPAGPQITHTISQLIAGYPFKVA